MSNLSPNLPVTIRFGKGIHFEVRPSLVRLDCGEVKSLAVVFAPKMVGELRENLEATAVEGIKIVMNMVGTASNTHKPRRLSTNIIDLMGESSIVPECTQLSKVEKKARPEDVLFRMRKMRKEKLRQADSKSRTVAESREDSPPFDPFDLKNPGPKEFKLGLPKAE